MPSIELKTGTAVNPLLGGDVPDISIIRARGAYYMVSTTMYFCPVAPVMKSFDLINWKIVSYCADVIEDIPAFRLETEDKDRIGDYGRGQWAASLRYFKDRFWALFINNTTGKSYLFNTDDPENGFWERETLSRFFYDPSIFFDEDTGRLFIAHGYGNITLTEMEPDFRGVKPGGIEKIIFPKPDITGGGSSEGTHVYKINGYYYFFVITWGPGRRVEICHRSRNIDGPFESRVVLDKGLGDRKGGVAQGGIIETPEGNWYGFFFQDRDAVGRIPVLVPMRWEDQWPVFGGADGNIPLEFQITLSSEIKTNLYTSDDFNDDALHPAWQWNHNPDNENWSLTERPGFLRLKTGRTSRTIYHARNTLTQRTFEPECEGIIALEPVNMKNGDIAGLVVLQAICGFIGIEQEEGKKYIVMYHGDNDSENRRGMNAAVTKIAQTEFTGNRIFLKANCKFKTTARETETASFSYSLDGDTWRGIGEPVNLKYTLTHFTGARFGLFYYAQKESGGFVDFDFYRVG